MNSGFIQIQNFFISLEKVKYINRHSDDEIDIIFDGDDLDDLEIVYDSMEDRDKEWDNIKKQLIGFITIPMAPMPTITTPTYPINPEIEITC